MVGLAPTVLGLTGRRCILLKLHPNFVDAIGFEPMFVTNYTVTPQRSPYMHPYLLAVYRGIEPPSPDRQSSIVAVGPIDHIIFEPRG